VVITVDRNPNQPFVVAPAEITIEERTPVATNILNITALDQDNVCIAIN
jgi:hypothetical protein